jgi:hypothetical protein
MKVSAFGLLFVSLASSLGAASAPLSPYLSARGPAWRLAAADLDQDGSDELVTVGYDGTVRASAADGTGERWRYELNSFPTALVIAPLENGARPSVLVAGVDGELIALDFTGRLLWRHAAAQALQGAAVARLDATTLAVVTGGLDRKLTVLAATTGRPLAEWTAKAFVQRLATGDLDGDGFDEIVVADHRDALAILRWRQGRLEVAHAGPLFLGEQYRNWESPGGTFKVFSLAVADLDGDARAEIIAGDAYFNPQAVLVLDGTARTRWFSATRPPNPYQHPDFYSTAWVCPLAAPERTATGAALVVVSANRLRLYSAEGKIQADVRAGIGFTDVCAHAGWLYLGSSPNGDDTVYRLPLNRDLPAAFAKLQRHGQAAAIGANLARLGAQVEAWRGPAPTAAAGDYWILTSGVPVANFATARDWFATHFPYPNLHLFTSAQIIEKEMPRRSDGQPWNEARWKLDSNQGRKARPVADLVDLARQCETARVPVMFSVGHTCTPFVTLDTVDRLLAAAPNFLRGFYTAEDEGRDAIGPFLHHFTAPVGARLAARPPGPVPRLNITKNKNLWWFAVPSWPDSARDLFAPAHRSLLVPTTEDSNSRTPELNLLARFGLRQAGLVDRLWVSYIDDLFSFNRTHEYEYPMHGHTILRLLVAHTLLGGSEIAVRGYGSLAFSADRRGLNAVGRESTATYFHLLGRGLVFAPRPGQMLNVAPVGFAVHPPSEGFLEDAFNGHNPHRFDRSPALEAAVLPRNGAGWGMTRTPDHALTAVVLQKRRQFGLHVPPTPFGLPVFVPAWADRSQVAGVHSWWETDGTAIWRAPAGARLTGGAAAAALRADFAAAAATLPVGVTGDDVFLQAVRLDAATVRVWLLDPGWFDPAARSVTLHVRLPGATMHDPLSGESVSGAEGRFPVQVPAGSLRILDLHHRPAGPG